jgi:uncharacterized Zn-binding protein involved in type VI secretion
MDGNGTTGSGDFSRFLDAFGEPPGPSGYSCAGTIPCPAPPAVALLSPSDGAVVATDSVAVAGTIAPADTPVTVNGVAAAVTGTSFTLAALPLGLGTNRILAAATHVGLLGEAEALVIRVAEEPPAPPPDPEPADVSPHEATSLFAALEFLYTGPTPVQTGVDPDAIAPDRIAAVRGRVVLRSGSGLPSVHVSVSRIPSTGCSPPTPTACSSRPPTAWPSI